MSWACMAGCQENRLTGYDDERRQKWQDATTLIQWMMTLKYTERNLTLSEAKEMEYSSLAVSVTD